MAADIEQSSHNEQRDSPLFLGLNCPHSPSYTPLSAGLLPPVRWIQPSFGSGIADSVKSWLARLLTVALQYIDFVWSSNIHVQLVFGLCNSVQR